MKKVADLSDNATLSDIPTDYQGAVHIPSGQFRGERDMVNVHGSYKFWKIYLSNFPHWGRGYQKLTKPCPRGMWKGEWIDRGCKQQHQSSPVTIIGGPLPAMRMDRVCERWAEHQQGTWSITFCYSTRLIESQDKNRTRLSGGWREARMPTKGCRQRPSPSL